MAQAFIHILLLWHTAALYGAMPIPHGSRDRYHDKSFSPQRYDTAAPVHKKGPKAK